MELSEFKATLAVNILCASARKDFDSLKQEGSAKDAVALVSEVLKHCGVDGKDSAEKLREDLKNAEAFNAVLSWKVGTFKAFYEEILAFAEGRAQWTTGSKEFWQYMRKIRDAIEMTEFNLNDLDGTLRAFPRPQE